MDRAIEIPRRVLLVDDDKEICKSWTEVLESDGWQVDACYDAEAVQHKVEQFDPSVVVLDLRMPKGDGLEVLDELQSSRPWTRVVVITGHGEEQDAIACVNKGAFAYLRKSVSNRDLLGKCEAARKAVPETLLAFHKWYSALPDPDRVVYHTASGSVTGSQLMKEICKQSPLGREFLARVESTAAELVVTRL